MGVIDEKTYWELRLWPYRRMWMDARALGVIRGLAFRGRRTGRGVGSARHVSALQTNNGNKKQVVCENSEDRMGWLTKSHSLGRQRTPNGMDRLGALPGTHQHCPQTARIRA